MAQTDEQQSEIRMSNNNDKSLCMAQQQRMASIQLAPKNLQQHSYQRSEGTDPRTQLDEILTQLKVSKQQNDDENSFGTESYAK